MNIYTEVFTLSIVMRVQGEAQPAEYTDLEAPSSAGTSHVVEDGRHERQRVGGVHWIGVNGPMPIRRLGRLRRAESQARKPSVPLVSALVVRT